LCGSNDKRVIIRLLSSSSPSLESNPTNFTFPASDRDFNACDAPTDIVPLEAKNHIQVRVAVSIFSATDIALARSDMPNLVRHDLDFGKSLPISLSEPRSRSTVDALRGRSSHFATLPLPFEQRSKLPGAVARFRNVRARQMKIVIESTPESNTGYKCPTACRPATD